MEEQNKKKETFLYLEDNNSNFIVKDFLFFVSNYDLTDFNNP